MICAIAAVLLSAAAAQDTPRHHSEAITSGRHEFTLHMAGTADGRNTRDPIVYSAWKQGFEPMRSVRIRNTGDADVVNPWVLVNGRGNWRTVQDIVREALLDYGDPEKMTPAEKARALWDFQRRHRFHATTGDFEVRDPVKMFNIYGFSLCGDNAPVLADLWRAAGLKTRRGFPIGHCVSEVWYGGGWHMLDADESVIFLARDNRTILPEKEVARDHDLARRLYPDAMLGSLYTYDGPHAGEYPSHASHTMHFKLRPGEALEWRWDHSGKHHHAPPPGLYTLGSTKLSRWGENAWARLANGKWTYQPDLRKPAGRRMEPAGNLRFGSRASEAALSAADPAKDAAAVWTIEAPYVLVGGKLNARVRAAKGGAVVFSVSQDREHWAEAARAVTSGEVRADLDRFFPEEGAADYRYYVRAEMSGGAAIDAVSFENDLQMAPLSLPALALGDNRITYIDDTPGARSVELTFDWQERSGVQPAPAPDAPRYPADSAEVEGFRFVFEWAETGAAYHFQLGDEPRVRWALTPAFDVTVDRPRFAIPRAGLLNPGQRYYWRVRAKSAAGVWGQWSRTWSFVPQGPGVPLNVRLEESDPGLYALRWDANPAGRKPAGFRIYASDEKGFPPSDEAYRAPAGNQKDRGLFPGEKTHIFPASLLAAVPGNSFTLRPTHAFYRVVAVDEKGNRSGESDYASAPRPFVYTQPSAEGRVGVPYRYEAKTIASIGDLTYRDFGPDQSYQSAYWTPDAPQFSLEVELPRCGNSDPGWLKIDPKTGVLDGTPGPNDTGEYLVNVKVEIPGAGTYVQSFPLKIVK